MRRSGQQHSSAALRAVLAVLMLALLGSSASDPARACIRDHLDLDPDNDYICILEAG